MVCNLPPPIALGVFQAVGTVLNGGISRLGCRIESFPCHNSNRMVRVYLTNWQLKQGPNDAGQPFHPTLFTAWTVRTPVWFPAQPMGGDIFSPHATYSFLSHKKYLETNDLIWPIAIVTTLFYWPKFCVLPSEFLVKTALITLIEHQLDIMSTGLLACDGKPPQLVENSQGTVVTPTQDSLLMLG